MIRIGSKCFCGYTFYESGRMDSFIRSHYLKSHPELIPDQEEIALNFGGAPYHCLHCYAEVDKREPSHQELHLLKFHSDVLKEIKNYCGEYFSKGKLNLNSNLKIK